MKRIALVGFTGWAAIVSLAYWQIVERSDAFCSNRECYARYAAQRDAVLTNGLTVALVGLLALMLVTRQPDQRGRLSRLRPTLPDMFDFVRSRRWLIGVGAAAALLLIVWFIARPGHWLGSVISPADAVAVVASDAVTDIPYALDSMGPDAGSAVGDEYANAPAYEGGKAAASEDPQSADDEPASAA